jgi:hypothetical protein
MSAAERLAALNPFHPTGAIAMAETRTDPVVSTEPTPAPAYQPSTPAADPAYNPAQPETRKTPIDNPPDGKKDDTVKVVYNPTPGDPDETTIFGKKAVAGEAVELPAKYADKARGNPTLSVEGEKTFGDDEREQEEPEEIEEMTFEENVLRERSKEYLEGHTMTSNAPGEAERVARAQQQVAEMRAAQESDDTDKPAKRKPGRPRKDPEAA